MQDIAHLNIEPAPDPKEKIKANLGTTGVTLIAGGATAYGAGHTFGLNPIVIYILVGMILGCALTLLVALIIYNLEQHKQKVNQMPVSEAFTTALQNLQNAYQQQQTAAIVAAVAAAEASADADATAAVVAATPVVTPPVAS